MKIELLPLKSKYHKELAMLIIETWKFDEFFYKEPNVLKFGMMYLLECLINQTYQEIAVIDGKVAGIILGADQRKNKFHLIPYLKYICYALQLYPEEKKYKKKPILHNYNKIMKEMRQDIHGYQDAEISLFLIKKEYQGLGIGKILFENLEKHFLDTNVSAYYVHTDTACNYMFYKKRGMQIISERKTSISYADTKDVKMFILGKCIK